MARDMFFMLLLYLAAVREMFSVAFELDQVVDSVADTVGFR